MTAPRNTPPPPAAEHAPTPRPQHVELVRQIAAVREAAAAPPPPEAEATTTLDAPETTLEATLAHYSDKDAEMDLLDAEE